MVVPPGIVDRELGRDLRVDDLHVEPFPGEQTVADGHEPVQSEHRLDGFDLDGALACGSHPSLSHQVSPLLQVIAPCLDPGKAISHTAGGGRLRHRDDRADRVITRPEVLPRCQPEPSVRGIAPRLPACHGPDACILQGLLGRPSRRPLAEAAGGRKARVESSMTA
jgi:hypothetical protein